MRIYIFGPQGVGKTTISKYIADKRNLYQISGSEIMMKICGANSREELKNMDTRFKREREDMYFMSFLERQNDIIVDGHGVLNDEQVKFFDLFIYLTCSPEALYSRRELDVTRSDRELSLDSINKDLLNYLEKCHTLESQGAKIYTIDNSEQFESTILAIENQIESFSTEVANESKSEYNGRIV